MTLCPSPKPRDHDARHVEARITIPWRPGLPVRVDVVHECQEYGCPLRLVPRLEEARDPEGLLQRLLQPRGMLAAPAPGGRAPCVSCAIRGAPCSHTEIHMEAAGRPDA